VLAQFAQEEWEQVRTETLNWSFCKEITFAPSAGIQQPIWFLGSYWKCFLIKKKT